MDTETKAYTEKTFRFFTGRDFEGTCSDNYRLDAWYYEPVDYEGDVPWSRGYPTQEEAISAATDEIASENY